MQGQKTASGLRIPVMLNLLMMAYAVFTTMVGAMLHILLREFALPVEQGGIFATIQNGGCLAGIFFSGALLDRYDKNRQILIVFAGLTLMLLAVRVSPALALFGVVLFLLGVSGKYLDAVLNAKLSELYTDHRKGRYMNILHASFGIGSFAGPLYASLLLDRGVAWRSTFFYLGLACLALFIAWCLCLRAERAGVGAEEETRAVITPMGQLMTPRMLCLCIILIPYCGHQVGTNTWLSIYMQERLGADPVTASMGISSFWLGLIVGRLLCSLLTRYVTNRQLILFGNLLGGALMLIGVLGGSLPMIFVGAGGAGLFAGATIPIVLTQGYTWYPGAQGKVSMILFICISGGGMVLPLIMGFVGMWSGMLLNGLLLLGIGVAALFWPKEQGGTPQTRC